MNLEQCKGVHCVDLGESFQTHIYLQNLASIQPRTSPSKFGVKFNSLFIWLLTTGQALASPSGPAHSGVMPPESVRVLEYHEGSSPVGRSSGYVVRFSYFTLQKRGLGWILTDFSNQGPLSKRFSSSAFRSYTII